MSYLSGVVNLGTFSGPKLLQHELTGNRGITGATVGPDKQHPVPVDVDTIGIGVMLEYCEHTEQLEF